MAYSKDQREEILNKIFKDIEEGTSARQAVVNAKISSSTFWGWIDSDEDKAKQYARACEERADKIADEILAIADHTEEDHTPFTGSNVVQRDRTRIDARKWLLGKLNPKKYGDKVDVTSAGEKLPTAPPNIVLNIVRPNEE